MTISPRRLALLLLAGAPLPALAVDFTGVGAYVGIPGYLLLDLLLIPGADFFKRGRRMPGWYLGLVMLLALPGVLYGAWTAPDLREVLRYDGRWGLVALALMGLFGWLCAVHVILYRRGARSVEIA